TRSLGRFRRRWDVALSAISDPLIIVGQDYRLEGGNPAAAELSQGEADDMEGQRCHQVLFARAQPCEGCPLESGSGEVLAQDKRRVFDARAYRLPGEDGASMCVYRD